MSRFVRAFIFLCFIQVAILHTFYTQGFFYEGLRLVHLVVQSGNEIETSHDWALRIIIIASSALQKAR
jgi:hypothetical protein